MLSFVCGLVHSPNLLISDAAAQDAAIWEEGSEFVTVVPQDDAASPANEQPLEISSENIATLLQALRVEPSKPVEGEEPFPVFTQRERDVLGQAIAQALSIAGPDQDVTFMTMDSRSMGSGGFARKVLVNKGRVFYQGGELNVIFGELRAPYRQRNVYGQMYPWPYRDGSRTNASKIRRWRIVQDAGVGHHMEGEEQRNDWIVIDPTVVLALGAEPEKPEPLPAAIAAARGAPTTVPGQPAEERLAVLDDLYDKGLIAEEAYLAKMSSILDADPTISAGSVEERLTALRELRDKELITEEVYDARTDELLPEESEGLEKRLTELKKLYEEGVISEELYRSEVQEALDSL